MPEPQGADPIPAHDAPLGVFRRFLKFGSLAWGGPAAQIAMISHECVEEERWVEPETFRRTLAVYQVMPGPEAHELCVYFGRIRAGKLGGLLAGLGFMLPGLLLMLALSVLYVEGGLQEGFEELFYGLQAAVGALVAMAIVRLGRKFLDDLPLFLIAGAVLTVTLATPVGFVISLAAAGLAYWLWTAAGRGRLSDRAADLGLLSPVPIAVLSGAVGITLADELLLEGLRAGLLTFGGAYTVVPLLQESAVDSQGWLTQAEFLDGLAIASILPAPMVIFGTFVGYIAGGLGGALAMTAGIFLPAFVLPIFFHRPLVRLADSVRVRPFLLGVAAGAIGLIASVTITILEAGIVDVPSALLALAAFLLLLRFSGKLTMAAVVLGCGIVGAALQLTVL
jgi:chromate transporter